MEPVRQNYDRKRTIIEYLGRFQPFTGHEGP